MTLQTKSQIREIAKRCDLFRLPVELIQEDFLFSDQLRMALLLGLLHKQDRMNKASYISNMKNLRDGKMLRQVKTYKCSVNKKFYNDESILSIFINLEQESVQLDHQRYLTFDEIIPILKLADIPRKEILQGPLVSVEIQNHGMQKNDNYFIGQIWTDIIGPVYKKFITNISWHSHKKLWNLGVLTYSFVEDDYDTFGYCCEDCDGPIEQYNLYNKNGKNKENVIESLKFILEGFNARRLIKRGFYTGPEVEDLKTEDL